MSGPWEVPFIVLCLFVIRWEYQRRVRLARARRVARQLVEALMRGGTLRA